MNDEEITDAGFLPRFATCLACKDCVYRIIYISKFDGKESGYLKGTCGAFVTKPLDVAFDGAPCPEYEKEL